GMRSFSPTNKSCSLAEIIATLIINKNAADAKIKGLVLAIVPPIWPRCERMLHRSTATSPALINTRKNTEIRPFIIAINIT
ncbi:MAG: hypothetical protein WBC74_03505, partial [Candidatus Omnitrophota bacterium]